MGEARLEETADAVDTPGPDVATPDLNVNPEDDAEDRASGRAGSRPITAADIPAEDPEAVSDGGAAAAAVDAPYRKTIATSAATDRHSFFIVLLEWPRPRPADPAGDKSAVLQITSGVEPVARCHS